MTDKREELMNECNDLGIEFRSNASESALQKLIDDFKDKQAGLTPSPAVKMKPDPGPDSEPEIQHVSKAESKQELVRKKIAERKRAAKKTKVVVITNLDKRENDIVSTANLSIENQHFAVGRMVPLDIPVELEQCLINLAESAVMTQHRDEIVDGKRTGNKIAYQTKKYAVSYPQVNPK